MFEDRHMFKFVCALLGFFSIIVPGPIVPIIAFVIAISMLIYKIKLARESREGFESLMLDIVIIIIVLIIDISFFVIRISATNEYNKYDYSSSSSQEVSAEDVAEVAIASYQIENLSQFTGEGNHVNAIKSGFKSYLQNELEIQDVTVKGNKITCNIGADTIIFTITKNDIEYSIK